MRSDTCRSTASGPAFAMVPDCITARAYPSVCSKPGTKCGSYDRMIRAAPSRLTYRLNHSGSTSWNRCHHPGRFASSVRSTNAVTSSSATPYAVSRICTYGIFNATSAVSIRRTVAGATRSTFAASSRLRPAASRNSCNRLPRTTWPTVGAARRSLTPRLPNAPTPVISLSRPVGGITGLNPGGSPETEEWVRHYPAGNRPDAAGTGS